MADGDKNVLPFPEATGTSTSVVHAETAEVVRLELYRVTHQPLPEPTGPSTTGEPPSALAIETALVAVPMPDLLGPRFTFEVPKDTRYPPPLPSWTSLGPLVSYRSAPLGVLRQTDDRENLKRQLAEIVGQMNAVDDALVEIRHCIRGWKTNLQQTIDDNSSTK